MNENEYRYRKTSASVGGTMLFFLGFLTVYEIVIAILFEYFQNAQIDEVRSVLIFRLTYGAGYLFCFMIPVLFLWLLQRKKRIPFRPMNVRAGISPWMLAVIPAVIAVVTSAAIVNSLWINAFSLSFRPFGIDWILPGEMETASPYLIVLDFIVLCVVPGFCEEFLFRGAILTNLLPYGRSGAILISSLLFALMHQNPEQFFYTFVAGVLLGLLYERTGNIWNGTILHIVNNFFSEYEQTILVRFGDGFFSGQTLILSELVLFLIGIPCMVLLIRRFFSKPHDCSDGVFGKEILPGTDYAEYPIPAESKRLYLTPTVIIFICLCALSMVGVSVILYV